MPARKSAVVPPRHPDTNTSNIKFAVAAFAPWAWIEWQSSPPKKPCPINWRQLRLRALLLQQKKVTHGHLRWGKLPEHGSNGRVPKKDSCHKLAVAAYACAGASARNDRTCTPGMGYAPRAWFGWEITMRGGASESATHRFTSAVFYSRCQP